MTERWLVGLPAEADGRVAWTNPGDGDRVCRRDSLARVATLAGRRLVAVVPGVEVVLTRLEVGRIAARDLAKAIPYLLEEQLSVPVETLHFALGRPAPDGWLPVAVVSRRRMEEWTGQLRLAGAQPEEILPAPLLLPWEPDCWSVLARENLAMARTGPVSGFAVDLVNLPLALRRALAEPNLRLPARIRLLTDSSVLALPDLTALGIPAQVEEMRGDLLSLMSVQAATGCGINLAQGPFAPAGRVGDWLAWLRLVLVFLVVWLGIKAGLGWMDADRLEQRIAGLDREIRELFEQTMPGARLVDPRVQMQQQLLTLQRGGEGRGHGFVPLFGRVAGVLRRMGDVELRGVRYQAGKLELTARVADLQRLEAFERALREVGLAVVLQGAEKEGTGVAARLQVEGS
ncbi:MAG: hypothetical protein HQL96_11185 [Magnetococcales bacterium]|nr:hypothetical protein [Magnetococcales bacterium]